MKLLYVVQAYGREVFGGAESHCRMMATRMAERGHDVDVVTSCATSYYDWADRYPPGKELLDGVTVHRLSVTQPRDHRLFGPLSQRVLSGDYQSPLFMQQRWIRTQGPFVEEMPTWLWEHALDYDVVVFFTYLYFPTVTGLPMTSGRVPTVLHPLAHDEPPLYLPLFDAVFKLPTGFAFSVEEDAGLVRRRFRPTARQSIVGIGVDLDVQGDASAFRSEYGLGDDPYLICVGRLDPAKGSDELYELFTAYKRRNAGPLKLVLVGEAVKSMEAHPDVVVTGFVPEKTRNDAIAGALASVHPSYFESFSMALTEAWSQRRPAIVNGRCEVFAGQSRRSGGALEYSGFAEFEAAIDVVLEDDRAGRLLGDNGRAYVERRYPWDSVLRRYEDFLETVPTV